MAAETNIVTTEPVNNSNEEIPVAAIVIFSMVLVLLAAGLAYRYEIIIRCRKKRTVAAEEERESVKVISGKSK